MDHMDPAMEEAQANGDMEMEGEMEGMEGEMDAMDEMDQDQMEEPEAEPVEEKQEMNFATDPSKYQTIGYQGRVGVCIQTLWLAVGLPLVQSPADLVQILWLHLNVLIKLMNLFLTFLSVIYRDLLPDQEVVGPRTVLRRQGIPHERQAGQVQRVPRQPRLHQVFLLD